MTVNETEFYREGTCLGCGKVSRALNGHDVCANCVEGGPPARPWNTPPEDLRQDEMSEQNSMKRGHP